ncbi:unnamed protein product [Symbiodinium natans]|uniref:Uncharacterized protein n=1 Tax=Symbiodinium natans TaxID=878477 RepID=A0A812PME3_9DINO|nr:unnamed protein product [Symbiodinium natans]
MTALALEDGSLMESSTVLRQLRDWTRSLSRCAMARETSSSTQLLGACEEVWFLATAWLGRSQWCFAEPGMQRQTKRLSLRPVPERESDPKAEEEAVIFVDLGFPDDAAPEPGFRPWQGLIMGS